MFDKQRLQKCGRDVRAGKNAPGQICQSGSQSVRQTFRGNLHPEQFARVHYRVCAAVPFAGAGDEKIAAPHSVRFLFRPPIYLPAHKVTDFIHPYMAMRCKRRHGRGFEPVGTDHSDFG